VPQVELEVSSPSTVPAGSSAVRVKKSRASVPRSALSCGVKSGYADDSLATESQSVSSSHCCPKSHTAASARGSASMRRACASTSAGVDSWFAAAAWNSVWSGMVPHSRYDSRDASSYGVSFCALCPAATGAPSSTR